MLTTVPRGNTGLWFNQVSWENQGSRRRGGRGPEHGHTKKKFNKRNQKKIKNYICDRSFHTNSSLNSHYNKNLMRRCWPVGAPIWRLLSEGGGALGPRGPFCGGGTHINCGPRDKWDPGCCSSPLEDGKPRGVSSRGARSRRGARVEDGPCVGAGPRRGCGLSRLWGAAGPLDGELNEEPCETEEARAGKRLWGAADLWEGGFRFCIESKGGGFVLGYEPGNREYCI